MKRYGNLYEKVYDIENIRFAHKNARKGKRHYSEVKMIDSNPDKYLKQIQEILKNKTFRNSEYTIMNRKMDSGKIREIFKLPYFPDRIIHHCIMQIIGQIWFKSLIRDTYSSIKNRGIHDGVKRIKIALRDKENTKYCLKFDVKKYYPSIDNEILKKIVRKKIKDKNFLWLLDEIINSTKGIPIGNYLSQYFGNLYLSSFDHFMKEEQKCKYYFRYCDDVVILSKSKKDLHELFIRAEQYFDRKLNLKIKENWQIFPIQKRGIDFLGYRFFHGYTLLRKSIKQKFIKKINYINKNWYRMSYSQIVNSVMSYWGWLKYANCKNLINKYINDEIFWIIKCACKKEGIDNPLQGIL